MVSLHMANTQAHTELPGRSPPTCGAAFACQEAAVTERLSSAAETGAHYLMAATIRSTTAASSITYQKTGSQKTTGVSRPVCQGRCICRGGPSLEQGLTSK